MRNLVNRPIQNFLLKNKYMKSITLSKYLSNYVQLGIIKITIKEKLNYSV